MPEILLVNKQDAELGLANKQDAEFGYEEKLKVHKPEFFYLVYTS